MKKHLDEYPLEIVIPAKTTSMRIPNKNFRIFHQRLSLTDIKIQQVLKIIARDKIHVFCDQADKLNQLEKYQVNCHLLKTIEPWPKSFDGILGSISAANIMTCFVTTPFINDKMMKDIALQFFQRNHKAHDSIITVTKINAKLLNPKQSPLNFGYGKDYFLQPKFSPLYELKSGIAIVSKKIAKEINCHFGRSPMLYQLPFDNIDINEKIDWEIAQRLMTINYYKKLL